MTVVDRTSELWAEALRPASRDKLAPFYYDPVAFALNCVDWPDGESLVDYQGDILNALVEHHRVAVRSMHGAGKTTTDALALLWFSLTRDSRGVDWKCPITAGAWRQLEQYALPEVHKWAHHLRWDVIGRAPFTRQELLRLNLNLNHGSAFAVASDTPAYIEGVHADSVFYIFDESKSIIPGTFDAAEGAFSGSEKTTEAYALATSTPGEPSGRFYDIHAKRPGLAAWHCIHVGLEDAIRVGRVSRRWAEQSAELWGPNSAVYANRVLGEFHSSDEAGVIPLSWVEAAIDRWRDNQALPLGDLSRVSVDVARFGEDQTVMALLHALRVQELRYSFHEDLTATAGRAAGIVGDSGAGLIVDTDGLGAGVTDILREREFSVYAFHGGEKTEMRDESGELGFVNTRSAAWWNLRQLLDPRKASTIELPPDDLLIGDLTAPHWSINSKSQIVVESKDDIRKRIARSTDSGDAVVQLFWNEVKRRTVMTFAGRQR